MMKTRILKSLCLMALAAIAASCAGTDDDASTPLCTVEVAVAVDVDMPEGSSFAMTEGYLALGNFAFYGGALDTDDPFLASLLRRAWESVLPSALAHAGHSHGAAEFEGTLPESFVVPLLSQGVALGTLELPSGHYFDGRFDLAPAQDGAPVAGDSQAAAPEEITGRTLYVAGTLTHQGKTVAVTLRMPVSSTVAGLDLASYAVPEQVNRIELRFQLGSVLAALPLDALTDAGVAVVIDDVDGLGGTELKIALKDRLNYIDPGFAE